MIDSRAQGSYAQQPEDSNDTIVSQLARQDKTPWYRKPNLRLLYLFMLPTCIGVEMTAGYDSAMVNGLQAVPSWLEYFDYPRSTSLGLMASMYALGCAAATPFAPFVVDKFGRRLPILLGGIVSIVASILQGAALNFDMFVIARFILGFANVFCVVSSCCLIGELSHPKDRVALGGIYHVCYYLGTIGAAIATLGTFSMKSNWGWRIPSLLQMVPSLLQVVFIHSIPESPRWLISTGRSHEAQVILVKYHAEDDEDSEFVKAESTQIKAMLEVGAEIARRNRKKAKLSPEMRKRYIIAIFLGVCTPWSGTSLIEHFLAPILGDIGIHDNRTKNIINVTKSCWKFASGTVIALIVTQYPRRLMYLICSVVLFVVLVTFTVASADYSHTHNRLSAKVVLTIIFLHNPAHNIALGTLGPTFLTELFPFHVRATGIAWREWCNRSAGFLAQFFNPIGIDAFGWRWYITYCVWTAFQVIFVYFMFPETSGRTLEELTLLYEEDRVMLRSGEVEILREQEEAVIYDTMGSDDHSEGINGEQR